jgi:hypothetical protein
MTLSLPDGAAELTSCFACYVSSSTRLVYVADEINERRHPLEAAEAYNVEGNYASYDPRSRRVMLRCFHGR